MTEPNPKALRICLRDPIPQIAEAARYLDEAVSAHLAGKSDLAEELIRRADMPEIREWSESLWGKNKTHRNIRMIQNAPASIAREQRTGGRMPPTAVKRALLKRDGYHCRFCGIPVIRETIRRRIKAVYPNALSWGRTNLTQHAAFQAMWVQYDHILPHARGGDNSLDNMVITCAPCNFGRMNYCLEEVGLIDPRTREPVRSSWDGLERFEMRRTRHQSTDAGVVSELESAREPKEGPSPSARATVSATATNREAFLTSTPAAAVPFFTRVFEVAQQRGFRVTFGSKGFRLQAPDRTPFFYCYPADTMGRDTASIEIFLKDIGDGMLMEEMRERFSRVVAVKSGGKFTVRLLVTAETISSAEQVFNLSLEFMERQVQQVAPSA
jgi:5-methylcytosine-specific restriction endonuclease McrA